MKKCDACHTRKAKVEKKMEDKTVVFLCEVCAYHENTNAWISRNNAKVKG